MVTRIVRWVAIALVAAWGVFGTLFVNGEVLSDPGGWKGIALALGWDVPLVVLAWLALRRADVAARVMPVVLAVVGALVVVDAIGELVDKDRWGPVDTLSLFVVAVPCGLLGVHRAGRAGVLLLATAAVTLVSTLAGMDRAGGQTFREALGGSTGVQLVPFLVLAALFLLVHTLERAQEHVGHPRMTPTGHA
jgi:hypothetical protein